MTTHHSTTVSSKGQVVIPSEVRRRLGLVQGSVLQFVFDGDGVRLVPVAGDVNKLKGRLSRPSQPVSLDAMAAAINQRRAQLGGKR